MKMIDFDINLQTVKRSPLFQTWFLDFSHCFFDRQRVKSPWESCGVKCFNVFWNSETLMLTPGQ